MKNKNILTEDEIEDEVSTIILAVSSSFEVFF